MSNRAINAVLDYSTTKGSQRLLMVILADGIAKDTGFYRARIETLRREANCEESYIHKLVKKLLATGELIVEDVPGHASKFYIPLFPGEPGYAPEECHDDSHTCSGKHTPLHITREDVRNADDYRRRTSSRGVRQSTLTGVRESTPHQKPRTGVDNRIPLGVQESTPPVDNRIPLGVQESTQYPTLPPNSLPINVPGDTPIALHEKEEGASPPHHPDVSPITEIRRDVGDTPSPPIAPPPLSPAPSTWRVIRAEMESVLSPVQRREWLDRLEFFHIEGDEWAIVTPTQYAAEFVENRWGGHFRAALHHAAGPDASLLFVHVPKGKAK